MNIIEKIKKESGGNRFEFPRYIYEDVFSCRLVTVIIPREDMTDELWLHIGWVKRMSQETSDKLFKNCLDI